MRFVFDSDQQLVFLFAGEELIAGMSYGEFTVRLGVSISDFVRNSS
jgi:hypothetical protein